MDLKIRDIEKSAILRVCNNYDKFNLLNLSLKIKLVKLIESGILNSAIDKSRERNIQTYWDNENFIELYSNIGYTIKFNIDIESSINKNKENKVRTYLIENLYNYILIYYLKMIYKKNQNKTILHILPDKLFQMILSYINFIDPKKIGYMSDIELNPFINQIYIDELNIRCQQTVKVKFSSMYTCNQCGSKKSRQREIQTRSGDEGGTLFINCLNCGHIWRQY